MRARNLKPSIFKNELLATSDALYTWIFEGLWCSCDREGRLEDRPRRIHLEINAGRPFDGTDLALNWLAENGFIVRYRHGECQYIQIVNFLKHQTPHVREAASIIPAPVSNGADTEQAPYKKESGTHLATLNPSSLNPPSPLPLPDPTGSVRTAARAPPARPRRQKVPRETDPEWWLDFKLAYPERAGDENWRGAIRASRARLAEGHTPAEMIAGAKRYAGYCEAVGQIGSQYVQQASRFLGPGKPFLLPWSTPPPQKSGEPVLTWRPPAEDPEYC